MTIGYCCNLVCDRFNEGVGLWYKRGLKLCARCRIAYKTKDNHCKCCGGLLRYKPMKTKHKKEIKRY